VGGGVRCARKKTRTKEVEEKNGSTLATFGEPKKPKILGRGAEYLWEAGLKGGSNAQPSNLWYQKEVARGKSATPVPSRKKGNIADPSTGARGD